MFSPEILTKSLHLFQGFAHLIPPHEAYPDNLII